MRKKRNISKATLESVTNRQLGEEDGGGSSNRAYVPKSNKAINPNVANNVRLVNVDSKHRCVFRVWNLLDPRDPTGELLEGRQDYEVKPESLSGWAVARAMWAPYVGVRQSTVDTMRGVDPSVPAMQKGDEFCVSYIISESIDSQVEGVPFWELPYVQLQMNCKKANKAGSFGTGRAWKGYWNTLMQGSQNESASIPSFTKRFFAVCSIYENGKNLNLTQETVKSRDPNEADKIYARDGRGPYGSHPDDPIYVLNMSKTAGESIFDVNLTESGKEHSASNVNKGYKYGDPVGRYYSETNTIKGGLMHTLYNPHNPLLTQDGPEKLHVPDFNNYHGQEKPGVGFMYCCGVSKRYKHAGETYMPSFNSDETDNLFNKQLHLYNQDGFNSDEYLLHIPSIEERCVLLVRAYKPVLELLQFAWSSHPEYLRFDSVQSLMNNRKTFDQGGSDISNELEKMDAGSDEEDDISALLGKVSDEGVKPLDDDDDMDDDFDDAEFGSDAELDEDDFDDDADDDDDDDDFDDDDSDADAEVQETDAGFDEDKDSGDFADLNESAMESDNFDDESSEEDEGDVSQKLAEMGASLSKAAGISRRGSKRRVKTKPSKGASKG